MAQTIKLKRSSEGGQAPSTSDLALGEVAINTHDGKMFIKKDDGTESIQEVAMESSVNHLKYHTEEYITLRDSSSIALSTAYKDVGYFTNIYDLATPVPTMRTLTVSMEVTWGYTSSSTNDFQLQLVLVVPSGTTNAVSLGNLTGVVAGGEHVTISPYEKWYYVSGNKTHLFTDFGRFSSSSSGETYPRSLHSYQYNPSQDRTYILMSSYPSVYSNGTEIFWHPYAWESAGTELVQFRYADERYRTGQDPLNFIFKTAYTDQTLRYKIQAKESGTGDLQTVAQSYAKIYKQEA